MAWLLLLVACSGPDDKETGPQLTGPTLAHTAPASTLAGEPLAVTVTATDDDGVRAVSLYHRVQGESEWNLLPMTPGEGDDWTATVEADDVAAPALEYWFQAADNAEVSTTAELPRGGEDDPFVVPVTVIGLPVPFYEDFELGEGETELTSLGWNNYSDNFRGYPWQLTAAEAVSGTTSVFHPHGYEGTDGMRDWLISPALDLSGVTSAQVTWKERGAFVDEARHKLLVSVGSRDPSDGQYVAVVDPLPAPPEGAWGSSAVYDLSAWAGEPAVYLAWYFEGVDADDWYIDDVRVDALQADLSLAWTVSPSPVGPGGSATLTFTVANATAVDATDVSLDLAFPEGGLTVSGSLPVAVGTVAGGGSASVDVPVTVDPGAVEPSYLPMDVTLAWSGAYDATWSERFLVGEASVAHVAWSAAAEGSVRMTLGVGDPDAPSWSEEIHDGRVDAGDLVIDADVTDQAALLPPAAGDQRWFLEVSTEAMGQVTAFSITHLGETTSATVLPIVASNDIGVCWLPEPPALAIDSSSTSPSSVSPGSTGVGLTVWVGNDGAATAGPLDATLSSSDPDVTVVDAGPYAVSGGVLDSGESGSVSGFSFDVSAAHTDSSAVELELLLDDGVESWLLPLSVAVPYPVLHITRIDVDDDGRDGILDPGEAAELSFTVSNVGDLTTSGAVNGTLAAEATSTASVTVSTNSESYGTLSPGGSRAGDAYEITVDGGAEGDTVDLLLTLVDGAHTYEARTTLVLGEPPWQSITSDYDGTGDTLEGWDFDLYSGQWRVVDDTLQLRFTSATAFDAGTLFIEAWGLSTGADYLYYRIVLQSGIANLQGYDSSTGWFVTLDTPTVSYPDALTVQLDVPLGNMGLFLDDFSMGLGSGWCGEPEYYCDHWPNGWGYPYDSFSTGSWFDLSW